MGAERELMISPKLKARLRWLFGKELDEKIRAAKDAAATITKLSAAQIRYEAEAVELREWLEQIDGLREGNET
jgi:hypothetical protein